MKRFMALVVLFLAVCAPAMAVTDANRVVGDDWDAGNPTNYPGTFVEAYDTEFNPEWYSWPVTGGIVDLEYNDVTVEWAGTLLGGRMYWKAPENYGGGPYAAAIDTTAMGDVYLVVRFKVDITDLAPDGTIGLAMELSNAAYGDLTKTVLRVPVVNGGDFVTVIANLSNTADTDPNTFQGQGGAVTWPAGDVVPDSLGFFAMQFGDLNDGAEVVQTGDLLSVDFLALTTDYTPYLAQAPAGTTEIVCSPGAGFIEEGMRVVLTAPDGLNHQWYFEGSAVVGGTSQELVLDPVQLSDAGSYVCRYDDESKAVVDTPAYDLAVLPADSLPVAGLVGLGILIGLAGLGGARRAGKQR